MAQGQEGARVGGHKGARAGIRVQEQEVTIKVGGYKGRRAQGWEGARV